MAEKQQSKKIISIALVLSCLLIMVVWTSSVRPVLAASLEQTPPPGKDSTQVNEKLEKTYKALLKLYEGEGKQLNRVKEWITRLEEQIKKAKESGKDTSKLVQYVDHLKKRLSSAQGLYDKAGAILKTHTGFDDNGKVTDPYKAYETLKDARQYLFEVQREIRPAIMVMQRKMFEHMKDLLPKK